MDTYDTTKGKARLLHQGLSQIEMDFFSEKPRFNVSKDEVLQVIRLAEFVSSITEEYNKIVNMHKRIFMKEAGVTSKVAAQSTEEDNRILAQNMNTYFSIDDNVLDDIEKFNSTPLSIPKGLLLTGFQSTVLPHEIRNAIKEFING